MDFASGEELEARVPPIISFSSREGSFCLPPQAPVEKAAAASQANQTFFLLALNFKWRSSLFKRSKSLGKIPLIPTLKIIGLFTRWGKKEDVSIEK